MAWRLLEEERLSLAIPANLNLFWNERLEKWGIFFSAQP
jgi:hypothetical protein